MARAYQQPKRQMALPALSTLPALPALSALPSLSTLPALSALSALPALSALQSRHRPSSLLLPSTSLAPEPLVVCTNDNDNDDKRHLARLACQRLQILLVTHTYRHTYIQTYIHVGLPPIYFDDEDSRALTSMLLLVHKDHSIIKNY